MRNKIPHLFYCAVDGVARLMETRGGLFALRDDLLVEVAPLQRPHAPRVAHSPEVLDAGRFVEQHSTASLANALKKKRVEKKKKTKNTILKREEKIRRKKQEKNERNKKDMRQGYY